MSDSQGTETEQLPSEGYDKAVQLLVVGVGKEDRDAVLELFDHEMALFNAYLTEKGQTDPLSRPESAILRTYLMAKHQGAF